eukprot:764385-Hanusia_phi.AAC.4
MGSRGMEVSIIGVTDEERPSEMYGGCTCARDVCDEVCRNTCEVVVEEARGEWRKVLGIEEEGVVLVRPDGYIAWRFVGPAHDMQEADVQSLSSVIV